MKCAREAASREWARGGLVAFCLFPSEEPVRHTSWVVKLSKLCNLRCGYCYEWDELGSPERMTLEVWERVLVAAKELARRDEARLGPTTTEIVLHGGEPLILPHDYLEALMDVRRRVLGDDPRFAFSVQTNLVKLAPRTIELLKRYDFGVGVSYDVVPGVRLSLTGRETERAVLANMKALEKSGVQYGAILVLAAHTAPKVEAVYDVFAERGIPLRILPLLEGPATRPLARFEASNDVLLDALARAFSRWIEGGRPIRVSPFDAHLDTVIRKMLNISGPMIDREEHGEQILVVGVRGGLNRFDDLYDGAPLGDLATQTLDELLASPAYRASFVEDRAVLARTCGGCEYAGACVGSPAFAAKHADDGAGRCPLAYRFNRWIEGYLRENGFDEDELRALVGERFEPAAASGF